MIIPSARTPPVHGATDGIVQSIGPYLITLLFLFSLFFIPNNKFLYGGIFIYVFILWITKRTLPYTLLLPLFVLAPFQKGLSFAFDFNLRNHLFTQYFQYSVSTGLYASTVLTVLFAYAFLRTRKNSMRFVITATDVWAGILGISAFVSIFTSAAPTASVLYFAQLSGLLILYAILKRIPFRITYPALLCMATCILLFEGVWGVLQYAKSAKLQLAMEAMDNYSWAISAEPRSIEDTSFFRAEGTFSDPNFLGVFLVCLLPIVLNALITKHQNRIIRILLSASVLIGITGILASASRTSWIVLTISSIFLLIRGLKHHFVQVRPFIKPGILLSALMIPVFIPTIIIPRLMQLPVTLSHGGGITYRWEFIQVALEMIFVYPFGVGLGMFPVVHFQEFGGSFSFPAEPHIIVAQIMSELGVIGLFAFTLLIISSITHSLSEYRRTRPLSEEKLAIYVACFSCLFLSMFYPFLTEYPLIFLLFTLLGLSESPWIAGYDRLQKQKRIVDRGTQ